MKNIILTTKEELNIYMSPVRQQLLRQLNISKLPMTPKMLADSLGISASAIQHHMKKLMALGLVVLDHTEVINGITARFYKTVQVTVQIGLGRSDGLDEQRDVLIQDTISRVYQGFREQMGKRISVHENSDAERLRRWGDILSGVVYLNKHESEQLMSFMSQYIEEHSVPKANTCPWEYAIIAYNTEEV